jgi:RNA polymerase sigma factor (sigma-70 family)
VGGGSAQEPTDAELHQRIIDGDEEAIAIWHDRTIGGVMKWLRYRKKLSPEDAEEVWNEACFETIRRADTLRPLGESLRRYVYVVAKNLTARVLEQKVRFPSFDHETLEGIQVARLSEGEPREVASHADADPPSEPLRRLRECLEHAPEKDQLVAKLVMENASGDEIARVLDVRVDNAYQIKRRTLAKLRRCIEGAGPWT